MFDFLYDITIYPIELFMEYGLKTGYYFTKSYGVSLVLLSLVVNTVILPIYNKADRWQDEVRVLKKAILYREKMIKRSFKGQERFAMISALYREVGYNPLMILKSSIGVLLQIPFFFAAYHLLSSIAILEGSSFGFISNLAKPDATFVIYGFSINILPVFMTIINLASSFIYSKKLTFREKLQLYGMAFLFLILLYNAPSSLTLYWTLNNIYSLGKNIIEKEFIPRVKKTIISNKLIVLFRKISDNINIVFKESHLLFWPAYIFSSCLIIIYFPINIYLSDPYLFKTIPSVILSQQIKYFIVAVFVGFFIFISSSEIVKKIISVLLVISSLSFFLFGFILSPDYGVIDNFTIQKIEALNPKLYISSDFICIVLVCIISVLLLKSRRIHFLKYFFSIGFIVILIFPIYKFYDSEKINFINKKIESQKNLKINEVPEKIKELCSFSKTEKNIVIVMLDMFTGGHIKEIIERNPDIKTELDGFVWYPDTVSAGDSTVFGKPCLLGGKNSTPIFINNDKTKTIEEKVNVEWGKFLENLDRQDFKISILEHGFLKEDILSKYFSHNQNLINNNRLWDKCTEYWKNKTNRCLDISLQENISPFLTAYGLFKVAPRIFRNYLYGGGRWCKSVNVKNQSLGIRDSMDNFASLDSLRFISTVDSDRKTFRFIENELTHNPWYIGSDGYPCTIGGGYSSSDRNKTTGIFEYHYLTELGALKSLIRWFKWMKENNIYDNTQIIIVSDHCRRDSSQVLKMWSGEGKYKPNKLYPINLHSLLLVKNFNSRGVMDIDSKSLMATCDIQTIVKNELGEDKVYPWKNINRERVTVLGAWQRDRHPENYYNLEIIMNIKGSMFNKENWKEYNNSLNNIF